MSVCGEGVLSGGFKCVLEKKKCIISFLINCCVVFGDDDDDRYLFLLLLLLNYDAELLLCEFQQH